jgi:hypothetical protein
VRAWLSRVTAFDIDRTYDVLVADRLLFWRRIRLLRILKPSCAASKDAGSLWLRKAADEAVRLP